MAKRLHYRVIEGELDAEAVFRQLFYRQGASFWLDSARIDAGYSRFSFMGITGCCGGRLLRYRLG